MSVVRSPKGGATFATNQMFSSYLFKDFQTRLFVPNSLGAVFKLALISEAQSLLTGEVSNAYQREGLELGSLLTTIGSAISELVNAPFLILGVTNISFANEHVIPTTKGIGSYGELIHLLGARNEQISLSFTTGKYPSVFGGFLRKIISQILREAQLVYIIDEMTGYIPTIMKSYKISKTGSMIGAISGTLNFISLEKQDSSLSATVKTQLGLLGNSTTSKLLKVQSTIAVGGWLTSVAGQLLTARGI